MMSIFCSDEINKQNPKSEIRKFKDENEFQVK